MNKYVCLFLLLIIFNAVSAQYVINASFEDGSRTDNGKINLNATGLACTPDCMQISDSFYRLGTHSQRSIVFENSPCTCGSSIRCEGKVIKNNADTLVKNKFYAASLFPRLYYTPAVDNKDELSLQWKTDTDNFPVLSLWERPSGGTTHWFLIQQYDTTRTNPTSGQLTTVIEDLGELDTDTWTDWTFEIDWQPNYTGYIIVYKNGVEVLTITGANTNKFYDALSPSYKAFRFGVYKFPWCSGSLPTPNVGEKIMYYDVIRVGNADMNINQFIIPPTPSTQSNYLLFNRPVRNSN